MFLSLFVEQMDAATIRRCDSNTPQQISDIKQQDVEVRGLPPLRQPRGQLVVSIWTKVDRGSVHPHPFLTPEG